MYEASRCWFLSHCAGWKYRFVHKIDRTETASAWMCVWIQCSISELSTSSFFIFCISHFMFSVVCQHRSTTVSYAFVLLPQFYAWNCAYFITCNPWFSSIFLVSICSTFKYNNCRISNKKNVKNARCSLSYLVRLFFWRANRKKHGKCAVWAQKFKKLSHAIN